MKSITSPSGNFTEYTDANGSSHEIKYDLMAKPNDSLYEKVYADPKDTIFLYGFGQGMLFMYAGVNTALGADLSHGLDRAWDAVTGRYELVPKTQEILDKEAGEVLEYKGEITADKIFIPENTEEYEAVIRTGYELTYYVNNINTKNTGVLMEYGENGDIKAVYTYGNERISVEKPAQTAYYLYDGRGSVAQTVSGDAIVSAYTYDPFGNVTSGLPEFESFYGCNAENTSPVTGLQYLRARYYDSGTGRFLTKDSYPGEIYDPLTLNRYSYVQNNPVMYADPTGHFAWFIVIAVVVGVAIGGTTAGVTSYNNQKAQAETQIRAENSNLKSWLRLYF